MIDRLLAERNVGRYGVDVGFVARTQGVGRLIPAGALAPIAEVFFLPEVLDTSLWLGGRHSYADPEGKYLFTYAVRSTVAASDIYFNTKLISVKEMAAIRSIWDFVDPSRFKSKIVFFYLPPARGVVPLTEIMHPDIGEKWIRKLFARELDVFFTDNARVMVDNVARGKRPLGMGMGAVRRQFNEVADAGAPLELWSNILPEPSKERPVLGNPATSHNFSLVDRAPQPNAAKLFINWWLTKEGQTIRQTLSASDTDPTLRTDVTEFKMVSKGTRLISGANYIPADSPYFTKDVPIWEARVAKIWEEVRK
jgi:ABC-type Fe3+ transport system substrate-binding protein